MKVTDYIVEFLQRKGIHDFFGYQGTMIAHLVDSIEKILIPEAIPAIMSRERLLQHVDMPRRGNGVHVLMRPAARVLRI